MFVLFLLTVIFLLGPVTYSLPTVPSKTSIVGFRKTFTNDLKNIPAKFHLYFLEVHQLYAWET